jgi:hypothetical protein
MASKQTTLSVVNFTGMDITNIKISEVDSYDWEGQTSRPDSIANFQNTSIANYNSRCQREEVNLYSSSSPFRMTITFSNGTNLSFRNDQKDTFTKHNRIFDCTGTATNNVEIFQSSGGDSNTFYVRSKQAPDNSNWMAKLLQSKPNVRLNQLTMPGSHDAGMYLAYDCSIQYAPDSKVNPESAKTQSYSIGDQLKAGSRYFDFRPYYDGSKYFLGHYGTIDIKVATSKTGCKGGNLEDVLSQVLSFIKNEEAITDIQIIHGTSSNLDAPSPDYVKIPVDLNKGAGGDYLYLCYAKNPSQPPITGVTVITGPNTSPPNGYTKIGIDLNLGAGSKTDYIYLCYTKQPNSNNTVLKDIIVQEGSNVQPPQGYTKISTDLNKGAGGADLFMSYLLGAKNPTNNPKQETVILKFSHTMGDSPENYSKEQVVSHVVERVKKVLGQYLYTSDNLGANLAQTLLSELKGKVVVVFTSEYQNYYDPKNGIFPYHDIPESGYGLRVYDDYSETNSPSTMIDGQRGKLANSGGYDKDYLFLLSWTLTGAAGLLDIEVMAKAMANSWLPLTTKDIRNNVLPHPNIIYCDFVDPYLCKAIIDLNF